MRERLERQEADHTERLEQKEGLLQVCCHVCHVTWSAPVDSSHCFFHLLNHLFLCRLICACSGTAGPGGGDCKEQAAPTAGMCVCCMTFLEGGVASAGTKVSVTDSLIHAPVQMMQDPLIDEVQCTEHKHADLRHSIIDSCIPFYICR